MQKLIEQADAVKVRKARGQAGCENLRMMMVPDEPETEGLAQPGMVGNAGSRRVQCGVYGFGRAWLDYTRDVPFLEKFYPRMYVKIPRFIRSCQERIPRRSGI